MKIIEWFLSLFIGKKAKIEKHKAYEELKKANDNYLKAKEENKKYISKYHRVKYKKA